MAWIRAPALGKQRTDQQAGKWESWRAVEPVAALDKWGTRRKCQLGHFANKSGKHFVEKQKKIKLQATFLPFSI